MEKNYFKEFEEVYKNSVTYWDPWWKEAKTDLKFYLGDQWKYEDKQYLSENRRSALVFNKIRRVVHLITGYQRKNRLSLRIEPIEGSDEKTAEQLSAIVQWEMQQKDGYNILSDTFEKGPVKTGLNLIRLYMDYSDDPVNGDICFRRVPYNKCIIDPFFTERNFQDASFILFREYLTKEELKSIFPNYSKDIEKMTPKGLDSKYPYVSQTKDMFGGDKFRYDEFWRRTTREVKILVDPATGAQKISPFEGEQLKEFLQMFPEIKVLKKYIKTVELLIFVDDELFYQGPDPSGLDDFPLVPFLGFWDPEYDELKWKLQGIIRCMRDPQTEINKRRSKFLDMMDNQLASGWVAEEGAVLDPASLFRTGQGFPIILRQGKQYGVHLTKIQPVDIPAGFFNYNELMDRDIVEIPGANSELFGMPENENLQVAGILAKMRQSAGLTILQDLFDNFRLSQKLVGQRIIEMIQKNYTPDKVMRIINEQPSDSFYNRQFGKYDCTPTEGVLTDTQRQMYFAQLLQLKALGTPIPWSAIIDAVSIEKKEDLKKEIEKAERMQAEATKAQLVTQMLMQATLQSRAIMDIASAEQKRSQAQKNIAEAILERVKTLSELSKLENKDVLDLLNFAKLLSEVGKEGEKEEKIVPIEEIRKKAEKI